MLGQVVAAQGTYSRNNPDGDWNWDIDPEAGPQGKGDNYIDWQQWIGAAPAPRSTPTASSASANTGTTPGGIATDLHYHIVAPFHLALGNEHPTRVVGMGGLWVYNDGREVPDTFMDSADYPGKYTITVESSQVNEIGPVTMLRGTKATLFLGDEWEGPRTAIRSRADRRRKPYRKEFAAKWGKERKSWSGPRQRGRRQARGQLLRLRALAAGAQLSRGRWGTRYHEHHHLSVRSYRSVRC
jgi:hypothetical protein